jgi:outer membrane protein assembly factor BamB
MRTGASASKIPRKPSLLWVTKVGPSVSSPIFGDWTIYVSTITGRIFASPCLSFDEGPSVFIGTYNGGMFCLNQSTGMIRWSKQIPKPVMASPATIKDKVFFAASDKRIYCFQIKDGSRIWDFETDDKIWSSPSLSEYAGVMFFGSLDSHIYGIDINTGRQTWKFPTMNIVDSSAAIASNMMLIGSRDGLLYVLGSETTPSYIR